MMKSKPGSIELIEAKGRLLIIGGAEDREGDSLILQTFIELAGGKSARLVVLTTATNVPEKSIDTYTKTFKRLGVKHLDFIGVSQREDAMNKDSIELAKKATGIFFTGGNQLHITSLMGGTPLQNAVFEASKRGIVIAGTSAGAAMMGSAMIIHGVGDTNPRLGGVEIATGSGLMTGCVIDTHFSQRGRYGRLLTAVAHFPQHIGFGIDEDTAMLVEGNSFKVLGSGSVTVVDASKMSYSDLPYVKDGQSLALSNVCVSILSDSYEFDLIGRSLIVPSEMTKSSQAAAAKVRKSNLAKSAKV